jgi:ubiquinone/menaquinone biosynthesis C-methylase UbiE
VTTVTFPAADAHREYFERQLESNEEFWRRFGRRFDPRGKRILDVGCGHGALSVELAQAGATVDAADLNAELVRWARSNLSQRYSDLSGRVSFTAQDVTEIPGEALFDVVVCKDTMEHVTDVGATLRSVHRLLRPGGQLWAGFSPLYFSPWGDHGRTGIPIPWGHALLPRRAVLYLASRHRQSPVKGLEDLGLNGMTPRAFRSHVRSTKFHVDSVAYNSGDRGLLTAMSLLRKVPPLEALMTVSIYAVLRKGLPAAKFPAGGPQAVPRAGAAAPHSR